MISERAAEELAAAAMGRPRDSRRMALLPADVKVTAADLERDPYGTMLRAGPRNGLAAAFVDAQADPYLAALRDSDHTRRTDPAVAREFNRQWGWTLEKDLGNLDGSAAKALSSGANIYNWRLPEGHAVPHGPYEDAYYATGALGPRDASGLGAVAASELVGRALGPVVQPVRLQTHPTSPFAPRRPARMAAAAPEEPAPEAPIVAPVLATEDPAHDALEATERTLFARGGGRMILPRTRSSVKNMRAEMMRRAAFTQGMDIAAHGGAAPPVEQRAPRSNRYGFRFADRARWDPTVPRFFPARPDGDKVVYEQALRYGPEFGADMSDLAFVRSIDRYPIPLEARRALRRDIAFEQALTARDDYVRVRTRAG